MHMNNIQEAVRLHTIVKKSKSDPFKSFVARGEEDRLEEIRKTNLDNLFNEAKRLNVRYVYIGYGELCGCEYKKGSDGWPAMWEIAQKLGFPGSTGNGDQYQTSNANIVFPENSYGGWDLVEERKLTNEEVKNLNFFFVVDKFRGNREKIPVS